jgi:hypothetical protein
MDAREQGQRRLHERFAHGPIAGLGDRSIAVDLAGSVLAWGQAEVWTDISRTEEARRIIDAGGVGQSDDGADTMHREQAPAYRACLHGLEHHPVQHLALLPQGGAGGEHRADHGQQPRSFGEQLPEPAPRRPRR